MAKGAESKDLYPLQEDSDDFDSDDDCGPPMTHMWGDAHLPTFGEPKSVNEHSPEALKVAGYNMLNIMVPSVAPTDGKPPNDSRSSESTGICDVAAAGQKQQDDQEIGLEELGESI